MNSEVGPDYFTFQDEIELPQPQQHLSYPKEYNSSYLVEITEMACIHRNSNQMNLGDNGVEYVWYRVNK